jgi:hypothetical protein
MRQKISAIERKFRMSKPRKMLSDKNAPYLRSLMALIETQSKDTIAHWCIDYCEAHILPIYEISFPGDVRPRHALDAANDWLAGKIKLPEVKKIILEEAHAAARELDVNAYPAELAAARCCGQCAATIHAPTHSLGLALYGALAIAYDKLGKDAPFTECEKVAAIECGKMEAALRAVAVENEPNPAKINWNC